MRKISKERAMSLNGGVVPWGPVINWISTTIPKLFKKFGK